MPETKEVTKINTLGKRLAYLVLLLISQYSYAITPEALPGSVQPGVISNQMRSNPELNQYRKAPSAVAPVEEKTVRTLGEEASKIKFKLNQIILEGNHVYSDAQLSQIYEDKIHKEITVAELQDIVQNITNYYRNNGYQA